MPNWTSSWFFGLYDWTVRRYFSAKQRREAAGIASSQVRDIENQYEIIAPVLDGLA